MPENDRLSGCLDEINVEFVEREATPRLLMKLSIQLHLAGLLLSNTVLILELCDKFLTDGIKTVCLQFVVLSVGKQVLQLRQ